MKERYFPCPYQIAATFIFLSSLPENHTQTKGKKTFDVFENYIMQFNLCRRILNSTGATHIFFRVRFPLATSWYNALNEWKNKGLSSFAVTCEELSTKSYKNPAAIICGWKENEDHCSITQPVLVWSSCTCYQLYSILGRSSTLSRT
jgi:hypothetical protein